MAARRRLQSGSVPSGEHMTRREFLARSGETAIAVGLGTGLLSRTLPALAQAPVTLSALYYYNTDAERDGLQSQIRAFEAKYPNIKVRAQETTLAKLPEILTARAVANDLPDVCFLVGGRIAFYVPRMIDLTRFLPSGYKSQFDPARWVDVQYGQKVVGVPVNTSVRAAVYNVDYFQKARLRPPRTASGVWTWDQLVEVAKQLQKAGAKYGLQFEKRSFDGWMPFLYQSGARIFTPDLKGAAINSREHIEAIQWATDLHRTGVAAPGILDGTEDPLNVFASGLSGMWLSVSHTSLPGLAAQVRRFQWDVMLQPKHRKAATVITGAAWVAFQTRYPEQAWQFVSFTAGEEMMAKQCAVSTTIPTLKAIRKVDWDVRPDSVPIYILQSKVGFNETLQTELIHPVYGGVRDLLQQELSLAVTGQKSAKQAADDMAKIVEDGLRKQ